RTISPYGSREVLEVIKGIPRWKSDGKDAIPKGALRNLPLKLLVNLTTIFNAVPVPKPKKDHDSPEGCRPISLVCTISKVLETLLLAGISDHLDYHRLLDDNHFGFRYGHSVTAQPFRITDHVTTAFNREQIAVMVSLEGVRQNPPSRPAAGDEELRLPC
ncbi:hypothetical protein Trydic_g9493, partial [Trypoxylus dichotomus]